MTKSIRSHDEPVTVRQIDSLDYLAAWELQRATADARVAGGPEGMWLDIFATNGDEIAGALAELTATLSPLERELTGGAGRLSACRALLEQGRRPGE